MSNTASHDYNKKSNSWVFACSYEYGAPLGGLLGCQSSTMMVLFQVVVVFLYVSVLNIHIVKVCLAITLFFDHFSPFILIVELKTVELEDNT